MAAADKTARLRRGWFFILLVLFFTMGEIYLHGQQVEQPGRIAPARRAQPLAPRSGGRLGQHLSGYRVVLANGRVIQGTHISDWGHQGRRPTLNGTWLFDPANPATWIRSNRATAGASQGPYVEFVGGDRLPCNFLGYRSGMENPGSPQLPHLLVQPTLDMGKPAGKGKRQVRVLSRWLRKVVMSSRSNLPLSPGTIFYADGSSEKFRSMRWSKAGVRLLLDSGVETVLFTRIAELHLLPVDPWDAYFEQLAVLLPDLSGRLVRVETVDGAVLSASDKRFKEGSVGNIRNSRDWWHVFQPAWSLDALWVRYSSVKSRIYSRPENVPLSSFLPLRVGEKRMVGGGGRWIEDRSVLGSSLVAGGVESARGFGVRAFCEMEFSLPDCVDSFRTGVGIDKRAGEGGCASASVFLREYPSLKEKMLYQSDVLQGSSRLFDSGRIDLRAASVGEGTRLVLLADPELGRTPAGADPFDIRDFVDWIEPQLALDSTRLRREVLARIGVFMPSLRGWSHLPAGGGSLPLANYWDETNPQSPVFSLQLEIPPAGLKLRRKLKPSPENRFLCFCARILPGRTDHCRLKVLVDGVERTRFSLQPPEAGENSPGPPPGLVFDLSPFSGPEIEIELQFMGDNRLMPVEISGLSFSPRRPGLERLYEEDHLFSSRLTDGDGFARGEWRDTFSGATSLLVSGGEKENAMLAGLDFPVRAFPGFGEYRWLRFAWKKKGGGGISLRVAHDKRFGPEPGQRNPSFRFYQGPAKEGQLPFEGACVHLHPTAPGEWLVQTVDLFEYFGEFNLTGLGFGCPDGEYALFDHIWLGRTSSDFDGRWLKKTAPRSVASWRSAMARKVEDSSVRGEDERRKAVELVAPGFAMSPGGGLFGEGAVLLQNYRGRPGVLRTHPGSPVDGVRLLRKFAEGMPRPRRMRLSVGHDFRGDWHLGVLANGESIVDMVVGPKVSSDGWVDLDLDLTGFKGKEIELEVINNANGWSYEYAYWWIVDVE